MIPSRCVHLATGAPSRRPDQCWLANEVAAMEYRNGPACANEP
jgi:hypothetical protein